MFPSTTPDELLPNVEVAEVAEPTLLAPRGLRLLEEARTAWLVLPEVQVQHGAEGEWRATRPCIRKAPGVAEADAPRAAADALQARVPGRPREPLVSEGQRLHRAVRGADQDLGGVPGLRGLAAGRGALALGVRAPGGPGAQGRAGVGVRGAAVGAAPRCPAALAALAALAAAPAAVPFLSPPARAVQQRLVAAEATWLQS
mmetsp:Transcript_105688/g.320721  ORF Transcript_105688/g.320721 Transcript_105688/m.320721 type:complete len:201 (+) Transcript_105688:419-1021(+)